MASETEISRVWSRLNWTDRGLLGWYLGLGIALLCSSRFRTGGQHYLAEHVVIIASILVLAVLSVRGRWFRLAHDWYPIFVFIAAFEEIARLSLVFIPTWQDNVLLRAEAALFTLEPNLWLSRWHGLFTTEVLEFGYFTFYWILPVIGGFLYPLIWQAGTHESATDSKQPFRVWMDATVLGYIVCYATYLLFPTEGPAHTLGASVHRDGGPFHWLVLLIQRHGGVHGNAFPSGHVMASVVALLAALRWKRRLGLWLVAPVILMCVGAVYDGYHYASDIVAGGIVGATAFYIVTSIRVRESGRRGVNLGSP